MPLTMSSREAQNNFARLLDTAQRTPVIVQRRGRDCAVMVSMQDYEAIQLQKNARVWAAAEAMSKTAKARGLTQEILEEILRDG